MRSTAARFALPVAVAIVVLVAIAVVVPPPAAAQADADGGTTFAIDLQPDGDARFSVVLRFQLESEDEVAAFEQLEEDHVSGSSSPLAVAPYERASDAAAETTGRQMEIRDVARTASLDNRTGRLTLSFTWTNFSQTVDDRLLLGDVFRTPSGTWLPRLEPGQELVVTFPDGYRVQSVSRPLQNGTIHVQGPATFEPGHPEAALAGSPPPWWSGLLPLVAGGAVLLAVLALALYYVYRYRGRSAGGVDEPGEPAVAGANGAVGNGGGAIPEPDEEDAVADDPLLSDEERVLRLLESEGGRMKQVDIVEATDWSNAKVSQLLSEMADDGRVDKLRIGRENLISLPGRGPGNG